MTSSPTQIVENYEFLGIVDKPKTGVTYKVRNLTNGELEVLRALPGSSANDPESRERLDISASAAAGWGETLRFDSVSVEYRSAKRPKPQSLEVVSSDAARREIVTRFRNGTTYRLTWSPDFGTLTSTRVGTSQRQLFRLGD